MSREQQVKQHMLGFIVIFRGPCADKRKTMAVTVHHRFLSPRDVCVSTCTTKKHFFVDTDPVITEVLQGVLIPECDMSNALASTTLTIAITPTRRAERVFD